MDAVERREQAERVAAWTKFVKNVPDWDWTHLLQVIDFQLRRFAKVCASGHHSDGKKLANQMQEVRQLIKRVLDDDYLHDERKEHAKRWGRLDMRDGKSDARSTEVFFYYPKAKTAADKRRADRQEASIHRRWARMRQRDIDKLFSLMARNLQKWWE